MGRRQSATDVLHCAVAPCIWAAKQPLMRVSLIGDYRSFHSCYWLIYQKHRMIQILYFKLHYVPLKLHIFFTFQEPIIQKWWTFEWPHHVCNANMCLDGVHLLQFFSCLFTILKINVRLSNIFWLCQHVVKNVSGIPCTL